MGSTCLSNGLPRAGPPAAAVQINIDGSFVERTPAYRAARVMKRGGRGWAAGSGHNVFFVGQGGETWRDVVDRVVKCYGRGMGEGRGEVGSQEDDPDEARQLRAVHMMKRCTPKDRRAS